MNSYPLYCRYDPIFLCIFHPLWGHVINWVDWSDTTQVSMAFRGLVFTERQLNEQGHGCDIDKQKFACLQYKVRATQPITTELGSYIPLVMIITWIDFGGILLEIIFLANFLRKFRMCFFKVKHSIGHISGMVGPIDVKWIGGASDGYWVNYVTLTFDLTHDLDLVVSRSKFEIAFFEEWGADWVDVAYSDWGDFRRRRAVDISSYLLVHIPRGSLCKQLLELGHGWVITYFKEVEAVISMAKSWINYACQRCALCCFSKKKIKWIKMALCNTFSWDKVFGLSLFFSWTLLKIWFLSCRWFVPASTSFLSGLWAFDKATHFFADNKSALVQIMALCQTGDKPLSKSMVTKIHHAIWSHLVPMNWFLSRMFGMVIEKLFLADVQKISGATEKKLVAVGITKILTGAPAMQQGDYQKMWYVNQTLHAE